MGKKNADRVLTVKPFEKQSLGRPRNIQEDNIKTDLSEMCCEDVRLLTSYGS
jgi:hypothetical protein